MHRFTYNESDPLLGKKRTIDLTKDNSPSTTPISMLNDDLKNLIINKLDFPSQLNLLRVSKDFKRVVENNQDFLAAKDRASGCANIQRAEDRLNHHRAQAPRISRLLTVMGWLNVATGLGGSVGIGIYMLVCKLYMRWLDMCSSNYVYPHLPKAYKRCGAADYKPTCCSSIHGSKQTLESAFDTAGYCLIAPGILLAVGMLLLFAKAGYLQRGPRLERVLANARGNAPEEEGENEMDVLQGPAPN